MKLERPMYHKTDKLQNIIVDRMTSLGLTPYEVAKEMRNHGWTGLSPGHIINYLRGNSSAGSATLWIMMSALGLEIVTKDKSEARKGN